MLCLFVTHAVWGIFARGYVAVGVLCCLIGPPLLWRLRRDAMAGVELCWNTGIWTLVKGAERRIIVPGLRSVATPLVICLVFREHPTGRRGQLWLYPDCAPAEQLRRLRVRLTLMPSDRRLSRAAGSS